MADPGGPIRRDGASLGFRACLISVVDRDVACLSSAETLISTQHLGSGESAAHPGMSAIPATRLRAPEWEDLYRDKGFRWELIHSKNAEDAGSGPA